MYHKQVRKPEWFRKSDVPGITYSAVDGSGYVHERYFKHHTEPLYRWALVRVPGSAARGDVNFFSIETRAYRELRLVQQMVYGRFSPPELEGRLVYPLARIEAVTWRIGR